MPLRTLATMSKPAACDVETLRRFGRPGPRYASYPSPAQFGPHFDADMLRAYIRQSNAEPIPRRLSLHLHIPFLGHEHASAPTPQQRTADSRVYTERLIREVEILGTLFDRDREVARLHLGGWAGSLTSDDISELLASVRSHFCVVAAPERGFSIELDPRTAREADIAEYVNLGFTRADIRVTDAMRDSGDRYARTVAACRERGFLLLNVAMCPSTHALDEFPQLLDAMIATRPDRFSLQEQPAVLHLADAGRADRAARSTQSFELAFDRLGAAGYEHLGLEQFVLPGDAWLVAQAAGTLQRNLLGYTALGNCDFVGLGVGAISHVGDCFSQNARDLRAWEQAIDAGRLPVWRGRHLDFDDTLRAEVIRQIVCLGVIDIGALERRYLIDFRRYFADACARLTAAERDGLVVVSPERIIATSRGRWLLRIIATCFDRYFNEPFEPVLRRDP